MEKIEVIKRLRVYMEESNGEGAWKTYVGSQLEGDVANFTVNQLTSLCGYMMEHCNVNDGKTTKDYLHDFLNFKGL